MSEQQFEFFIDSISEKQKLVDKFSQPLQEESKPVPGIQNLNLRDCMLARGWR